MRFTRNIYQRKQKYEYENLSTSVFNYFSLCLSFVFFYIYFLHIFRYQILHIHWFWHILEHENNLNHELHYSWNVLLYYYVENVLGKNLFSFSLINIRNAKTTCIIELKLHAYLIHIILSAKLNYVNVLLCIKFAIRYHERSYESK